MTAYVLVSFKTCPWVQRVAIVLREKNVAFEFRHIEPGNRPDWFGAISPHRKVPVLRINGETSLFESNAIVEYLEETEEPPLHPADPLQRAVNRAWTDYLPTFASTVTAAAYAENEAEYAAAVRKTPTAFARLEQALDARQAGPFFNGQRFSLVDAGYAPFLQRYFLLDQIKPQGLIDDYPRLKAWGEALVARPSTHSFPPIEFEAMYRANLKRRGAWLSHFVQTQTFA